MRPNHGELDSNVLRALAAHLEQQQQAKLTAQLDRVYDGDPGHVDPVLAGLQARALGVDW